MALSRREWITGSAAALSARAQGRRPNFLFLIADDHAGYVLGADGNRQAETPNLDRMASQGTRFASNFCNSPVCTPSRQSFLTGQLPHAAGVTVLRTPLNEDKPTIAKQLKKAGYQTAVLGKMHFNRPSAPGLHGFDFLMTEGDLTKAWNSSPREPAPENITTKKLPWRPFADPARIWLNAENLPYPCTYEDMRGTFLAQQAVQYLDENKDKPFALWVSFQEPHSPFDFPFDLKKRTGSKFRPPRIGKEDAWQIPLIFRELGEQERAGIIAAYYNSVHFLDRNLGLVLDHLRKLNLEENTFVVYMADHGYCLGHHGRFEKHCCYEPALRVPLLMRWPGRIRESVVRDMTESADLPHTILDLLDAPPLPVQHGRSLRPYLEGGKADSARDHIFSEYLENEEACIRTARHKFVYCSGQRERQDGYKTDNPAPGRYMRLFDLQSDPGEFTDVAGGNPEIVERLKSLMIERFRKTHPDAEREPSTGGQDDLLDWYLRPRDA